MSRQTSLRNRDTARVRPEARPQCAQEVCPLWTPEVSPLPSELEGSRPGGSTDVGVGGGLALRSAAP
jgi:hypothetical protein